MAYYPDKMGIGSLGTEASELHAHGLDIFSPPQIETATVEGKTVEYYPQHAISTNPWEFLIPSHNSEYIYLPLTRLEGKLKVTSDANATLTADEDISTCNLLPASLFRQIEVYLNGELVSDNTTSTYPYKTMIETELSYGREAKMSHLIASNYIKDVPGTGKVDANEIANSTALKTRSEGIAKSKTFHFSTPLHVDMFACEKYLAPGCELKLKFIKNEDKFCIIAKGTTKYKIDVSELRLYVRHITVNPKILAKHNDLFNKGNKPVYDFSTSKIKVQTVAQGALSAHFNNVINGALPKQLVICFVRTAAFEGDQTLNPYNFEHFDISQFALRVNGSTLPATVFTPNFTTGDYLREYRHMVDNSGIGAGNNSNGLTPKDFEGGKFFLCYDLSAEYCNGFHLHPTFTGNIDIEMSFKKVTPCNINMLIYGSYSGALVLDKDRKPRLVN
jgi:hypothetical protein